MVDEESLKPISIILYWSYNWICFKTIECAILPLVLQVEYSKIRKMIYAILWFSFACRKTCHSCQLITLILSTISSHCHLYNTTQLLFPVEVLHQQNAILSWLKSGWYFLHILNYCPWLLIWIQLSLLCYKVMCKTSIDLFIVLFLGMHSMLSSRMMPLIYAAACHLDFFVNQRKNICSNSTALNSMVPIDNNVKFEPQDTVVLAIKSLDDQYEAQVCGSFRRGEWTQVMAKHVGIVLKWSRNALPSDFNVYSLYRLVVAVSVEVLVFIVIGRSCSEGCRFDSHWRPGSFLRFNSRPIMYDAVGSLALNWSWTR